MYTDEDLETARRTALRDPAWQPAFDTDGRYTPEQVKQAVRAFLLDYAWLPKDTPEQKTANVDCIMAQGGWQWVQARADAFAGAQFEPGPKAFDDGVTVELTSLYECHTGPHTDSCPRGKLRKGRKIVSVFAIIIAGFLIMLAVLGHGVWHGAEVAIASFVVNAFTGAHVSG